MFRSDLRRARGPMALTAILQTFLLISSLVLTPALVIAQDEQAGVESAPAPAPALALFIQPDPVKLQVGQTEPVTRGRVTQRRLSVPMPTQPPSVV